MRTAILAIVCCFLLALIAVRLPRLRKGKIDLIGVAATMLLVVMLLAVSPIYRAVDAFLGGCNLANLISHLMLYGVFWVVGLQVASALGLDASRRAIRGPINWVITAMIVAGTIILFFLADVPTSSMGLDAYDGQAVVQAYQFLGRLYPAVIAVILLASRRGWQVAFSVRLPLLRLAAVMVVLGLVCIIPSPVFQLFRPYVAWTNWAEDVSVFSGALLVAIGSLVTSVSRRRSRQLQQRP